MTLFAAQFAQRRRQLTGWAVGVLALSVLTVGSYPAIRDQAGFEQMVTDLPEPLKAVFGLDTAVSILSPAGYLQGRVFSLLLPALLTVLAVSVGAKVLAGDEEEGTLEVLVTTAVTRRRIASELAATMVFLLAVATAVSIAVLALVGPAVGLDVALDRLLGMHAAAFMLALVHGAIAFGVATSTGRSVHGIGAGGGVATVGYVLAGLGDIVPAMANVRPALPWHWYADGASVAGGVTGLAILPAAAIAVLAVMASGIIFDRRDLRTP